MASEGTVYRQIARKLTPQRPGEPQRISERPRASGSDVFLDSDEEPTLITIYDEDVTPAADLLKQGAIAPYVPRKKAEKEAVAEALAEAKAAEAPPKVVALVKPADKPKDGG